MARNFGQYDSDNPVMSVLVKAKEEQEKKDAAEILKSAAVSSSQKISQDGKKQQAEETEEKGSQKSSKDEAAENGKGQADVKKILMNISIRETTKKDWKMFFLEHDLTMTQGIETAVEFLKSEVEKGGIKLSKGGITRT